MLWVRHGDSNFGRRQYDALAGGDSASDPCEGETRPDPLFGHGLNSIFLSIFRREIGSPWEDDKFLHLVFI
jgi:hypothetical protein